MGSWGPDSPDPLGRFAPKLDFLVSPSFEIPYHFERGAGARRIVYEFVFCGRPEGHRFLFACDIKCLYLQVAVSEGYRLWEAVPQGVYLDKMMQHLRRKYYVSLLSAAERHGAA